MHSTDPLDLLYGGLSQLGPGSDADTLHVLQSLPSRSYRRVVDAGCGTGRQTLVLARALGVPILAVDLHRPFLDVLSVRACQAGLEQLVEGRCLDMREIPRAMSAIDLLWSEGAAYSIGFQEALEGWRLALAPEGVLVASELCWLTPDAPSQVKEYFRAAYPAMRSVEANIAGAEQAGYRVTFTHSLPAAAWTEGYYDVLRPRALALLGHPDKAVHDLAAETLEEVRIFEQSEGSYGYVFFVLEAR